MGGDMILSIVKLRCEPDETRERMIGAVNKLNEKCKLEQTELDHFFDIAFGETAPSDLDKIKQKITKVIDAFFDCLDNRDVTSWDDAGCTHFATGGMSWGDTPTDSLPKFDNFSALPARILRAGRIR